MEAKLDLKGLGFFILGIVNLIDRGETESVKIIEEKICSEEVVEYIANKYLKKNSCIYNQTLGNFQIEEHSRYNLSDLNKAFQNYGFNSDKYCVSYTGNGLLLLVAIATQYLKN